MCVDEAQREGDPGVTGTPGVCAQGRVPQLLRLDGEAGPGAPQGPQRLEVATCHLSSTSSCLPPEDETSGWVGGQLSGAGPGRGSAWGQGWASGAWGASRTACSFELESLFPLDVQQELDWPTGGGPPPLPASVANPAFISLDDQHVFTP